MYTIGVLEKMQFNFGKYKGKQLKNVPDDYLHWAKSKNLLYNKYNVYYRMRFNLPPYKYQVTVEDAVKGDGIYLIRAYSKREALKECKKKILCTQSFHGTSFTILKITK